MKKRQVITILSMLLIILWIYAALSKLLDYPLFLAELNRQPFPKWTISPMAIVLPLIEIGVAILLGFQRTKMAGFTMSLVLMVLFTGYVALAITGAFGRVPCPCAGIIGRMHWVSHLVFNLFFTIISYVGYYLEKHVQLLQKSNALHQKNIIRE